jgi:6-phosphogluconolactonase
LTVDQHRFASAEDLDRYAADEVGRRLAAALATGRKASLVVPGGKTPANFLSLLGASDLDWTRVQVTLSDERWVPASAPESNEGMLQRTLLAGKAAAAQFVSLYADAPSPEQGIAAVKARLVGLAQPIDIVVLGMGTDGHFASLFPGDASLAEGLDLQGTESCLAARGLASGPHRLSLSLPFLVNARQIFVFAAGDAKLTVWDAALAGADYPIGALQRQDRAPVDFLWCP